MIDGHASDKVAYRQGRQLNLASVVAERNSNTETLHHDGIEKELSVFPSEVKTAHARARDGVAGLVYDMNCWGNSRIEDDIDSARLIVLDRKSAKSRGESGSFRHNHIPRENVAAPNILKFKFPILVAENRNAC